MKNKFKLSLSLFIIFILISTSVFAASLPNRVLPFMSRGNDVVQVQSALNSLGTSLSVDGIYGNLTREAVRSFQKRYSSLTNDGIYGPSTKSFMEQALRDVGKGDKPSQPTGKVAYLTFDDGPSSNVTPRILNTLNDYGIKATFFMLGNTAEKNPGMVKNVYENGHSIGNHTYSHNYSYIYGSLNNFSGEVYKTDGIFKSILGNNFETKLFRFPGGSFENYKAPYRKSVTNIGYRYYDWNALNGDTEVSNSSVKRLVGRIKETTRGQKELIVLMHDSSTKSTTADALPEIIEYLQGQGYAFEKLSQ